MLLEKIEKNRFIIPALLIMIMVYYFASQPGLFTTRMQNNDSRITLHGYLHLYDMPQFKHDPLNVISIAGSPPGYRILHYILSPFISIMIFPKIIQIACVLFTFFFAFKIGRISLGRIGGVLSVWGIISLSALMNEMVGGIPRTFGLPFLTAMLYYLLSNNRKGLLVVSLGAVFFYPQAMMACITAIFLKDILEIKNHGIKNFIAKNKQYFLITGFVYGLIVIISLYIAWQTETLSGGFYTLQEIKNNPSYADDGRLGKIVPLTGIVGVKINEALTIAGYSLAEPYSFNQLYFLDFLKSRQKESLNSILPFFYLKIINAWISLIEWDIDHADIMAFLIYASGPLILYLFSFFRLPPGFVIFATTSFLLYFTANIFALKFYLPIKFLNYPFFLMISQFFVIGLGYASKNNNFSRKHAVSIVIVINIMLIVFSGPGLRINNGFDIYIWPKQKPLYEYIEKNTQPDDIFAGRPLVLDSIPLFAKRRVLISWELSNPFFRKINEEIKIPRLTALSKAYFADKPEPIRKLKSDFGVKYMIVLRNDFMQNGFPKNFIFAPFKDIARATYENAKGNWLLKSPPEEAVVFEDQNFLLVDIDKL